MKKKFTVLFFILLLLGSSCPAQNISDVLENAMSSVVTVAVYKDQDAYRLFGFQRGKNRDSGIETAYKKILDLSGAKGSGSGFVVERNGKKYVITNAHVVETASDEPNSIYVFSISQKKYRVKVLGGDSFYDVAVLKFVDKPGSEIGTIDFRKKDVRVGESVYAIGNPLGEFPYSVSDGIIGGKNRVRNGVTGKFGFLQSTATVIWGNSGGPLIDTDGRVVGINSQIEIVNRSNQSFIQPQINFALQSDIANKVVNDVINNHGFVRRAYLGAEFSQTYKYNSYGQYVSGNDMAVLTGVIPGSPAAKVLQNKIGSEIIKVGDITVRNVDEVLGEFEKIKAGSTVKLVLKNGNEIETVSLSTKELNTEYLSDIAKYALSENNMLKFARSKNGLLLKLPDRMGNWRVMSAGINSKKFKHMWMIKSLSDLGAALRFAGMYGVVDLFIANNENVGNSLKTNRVSFSGKKNVYKIALWY